MIIELVLLGTIFGLTNNNQVPTEQCAGGRDMVVWLFVFGGYLGAQFVYDFYYTVVFGYVKRASEVSRVISDFIMTYVLYGFGVAWLIYGNVLVYNSAAVCRTITEPQAETIWRLFISIIAIGYLFFIFQLFLYTIFFC